MEETWLERCVISDCVIFEDLEDAKNLWLLKSAGQAEEEDTYEKTYEKNVSGDLSCVWNFD